MTIGKKSEMELIKAKSKTEDRFSQEQLFKKAPFHFHPDHALSITLSKAETILIRKINTCKVLYNHLDTDEETVEALEFKRHTLINISEFMRQERSSCDISDTVLKELFTMFTLNIFRGPPPHKNRISSYFMECEEEKVLEPSWPHLEIVYDILLKLLLYADPNKLSKFESLLNQAFVLNLLDLFDSEDPRERTILKIIVHRIYKMFNSLRPFMRKVVSHLFWGFIFEGERNNGIAELLEIVGSIIHGFVVPLKEEHRQFMTRVLVPLYKPKVLQNYHDQLHNCVMEFVQKDCRLAGVVIEGFIKFWPVSDYQKELMLLGDLEEVLEYTPQSDFSKLAVPLARLLAKTLNSPHSFVADRALCIWDNGSIVNLALTNMEQILPILLAGLEKNITEHLDHVVKEQSLSVKKKFEAMFPELFAKCYRNLLPEEFEVEHSKKREHILKKLEFKATLSAPSSPR